MGYEVFEQRARALGLPVHQYMRQASQRALKLTARINGSYHEPEEVVRLFTELTGGRSAVVYTDTVGRQFSAQYPDEETVNRCAIMNYFDDETNDKVNIIWENIRGTSLPVWVFIVIGVVVVGIIAFFVVRYVLKNRRGGRRPKKGYKVISKG